LIVESFAAIVASEPAAARLVLVDSLALGGTGVGPRERAAERFQAMISESFTSASGVAGLECSDRAVDAFTAVLRPRAFAAEPARRPPEVVLQAIGGGLWASIQHDL
jgi:hypothetical protein